MTMTIIDVCLACDTVECGYRIVELEDGRFAFVWGNIRSAEGDELTMTEKESTCGRGVSFHDNYDAAIRAWRECAECLQQSSSKAGDEMLAMLSS
jgi:hypothetical protein